MKRVIAGACAVVFCAWSAMAPTPDAAAQSRALPMHFELQREGPAEVCGSDCRTWVSAIGAITGDTPRAFEAFAKSNDIRGLTLALDSDGGSVLGALALGRLVREVGMATTVGRSEALKTDGEDIRRARLLPRATCESMCAFVLLAGVERRVPAEARVMVHQIWLGDRRDDPTAASYSAEDLVLVQRDIGRLAQYTVEMGAAIDLLEMSLRIPPWEPMRDLTREELRAMRIVTAAADDAAAASDAVAVSSRVLASGPRAPAGDRRWVLAERDGGAVLTRRHPLTVEGTAIGSFELLLACSGPGRDYALIYTEQRRGSAGKLPGSLTEVEVLLGGEPVRLDVVSSRSAGEALDTVASGTVPADLVRNFADARSRSLTVETSSSDTLTAIRIGNAGIARSFPRFAAGCIGGPGEPVVASRPAFRREAVAQPR